VSWHAEDPDNDELRFDVELTAESGHRVALGSHLKDPFVAFDETRLPDGLYRVRITASDEMANPVGEGLRAERSSSTFALDRTPPALTARIANSVVSLSAQDLSPLIEIACGVDGAEPTLGQPTDGLLDGPREEVLWRLPKLSRGKHFAACGAQDAMGNVGRVILTFDTP
jgi:hypothetical protein